MATEAQSASGDLSAVRIPSSVRGFDVSGDVFDVAWSNGVLTSVTPCPPGTAVTGTLVPAAVDIHLHLDKSHTVHRAGAADGDLFRAIELISQDRARWTSEELQRRIGAALEEAWRCGTRALRTHLDWMDDRRPLSVDVLLALQEQWRDRLEIQWVSLSALDQFEQPAFGTELAHQVKASGGILGCFVYRNEALRRKLHRVFALAAQHGLDLDFHVDEGLDVDANGLADIAELTLEYGWQGRVTCGHACSLSVQADAQAHATLQRLHEARVGLVALPTTNLYLQGAWNRTPVPRGITRVREAAQAGVTVCLATDNVADPFYPYGSYDALEAWSLGVQVAHLPSAEDWLPLVGSHPARLMGLERDGRIRVGAPADFMLTRARDAFELMSPHGRQRTVFRKGLAI